MKNFAEFFAGVGLVNEGLMPTGWNCIWANDISENKQETYIKNYGKEEFWLGDIWKVAENPDQIPDGVFLYTASFPCTDLSVAGARAGLKGEQSGTLHAFLEILKKKVNKESQPQVILLENVRGFLTSNNGNDVAYTVEALNALGYRVDIVEIDAIYFSAQSRPRVFLIGVLESLASETMIVKQDVDLLDNWWLKFDEVPHIRTPKIRKIIQSNPNLKWGLFDIFFPPVSTIKIADIVETDLTSNYLNWWDIDRSEKLRAQMSEKHQLKLDEMVDSQTLVYGTVYRRMRYGRSMAELRTDGIAGCLRTPKGGSSKQILIEAGRGNWRVRLLTPREYARLQGVRDSFIMPENHNQGYFAMGDAVCVPVINFLAQKVLDPLYIHFESAHKSELQVAV